MSRLPFAPPPKEIAVTDIKGGIAVFTPRPDFDVSFAALHTALKKAGYKLGSAEITARGKVVQDGKGRYLLISKQRFLLEGASDLAADSETEIVGAWKTVGVGTTAQEVITITPRKSEVVDVTSTDWAVITPGTATMPIRTVSPGLTVYQGGAVMPRYQRIQQSFGTMRVTRDVWQLNVSYTPTPTLQLEAEIPYVYTRAQQASVIVNNSGLGNITLWGKYRFFRVVEQWGDKQAAVRFGLELPSGQSDVADAARLNVPSYLRQQLAPINGGTSAHLEAAYSQAKGRWIFGGNVAGIVRSERNGFHIGHEFNLNTDLEYVLFPFKYRRPTKELFGILETNLTHRGNGRSASATVANSDVTVFSLLPGLQYVASTRIVLETSYQWIVAQRGGGQALRPHRGWLFGLRFLY
ncbi:MAG TPA: hypothetical protein VFZ34_09790 [Blastocatellia bacterium]|nr:hypothetical protein [Blastocatellia bacterium]